MLLDSKIVMLIALILAQQLIAHQIELKTPEEVKAYEEQQRSIHHCFPIIEEQLIERKSSWLRLNSFDSDLQNLGSVLKKYETLNWGSSSESESRESQLPFGTIKSTDKDGVHLVKRDSDTCVGSNLDCQVDRSSKFSNHKLRNHSCVLSPFVTSGPYYHRSEHPIRQNLAEWQDGLPLLMDIGVIDVETCEPIKGALVDIWHANATGFYAGYPETKKALEDITVPIPRTNYNDRWLRGAWPTNSNGVAQFTSIFPGFYTGRATHVHAKVHLNFKINNDSTFDSAYVQYVGQFFFDEEINFSVDQMSPYRFNPSENRTLNSKDSLNIFSDSFKNFYNPIFEIEKIGSVISQGLIGFITVGINMTAKHPN
ncbi:Intradiol ring-cleavage dioxygenase [Phakopsora pachyrhizi]|uniref:Intradiol ring-cleavage dioxygenase n=2 Tax=Phakopsora pachyrhizi TaxID=170000 RepID=A0AAV0BPS2_PHAPC|nr:Intradiol ring-cleavage dioxygenase [Phakopsora pachyrhizi]KAI8448053.1 Intradiol ring-cleavage dioxygenase [Phakopsora pachyrhizi]CAH7689368.1 Intradiol ring-cleavage dioxygenase [Phakopsora pachyrhizi]